MNPIEVNFTIDPMDFPLWIGAYLVIGVAVCALILWQELFVRITKEHRQSIMRGKGAKARHVKSSLHAVVAWPYVLPLAIIEWVIAANNRRAAKRWQKIEDEDQALIKAELEERSQSVG